MFVKKTGFSILLKCFCFLLAFFFALKIAVPAQSGAVELNYNFRLGALGWTADFADYPLATDNGIYELDARIRLMPRKLTRLPQRGFYIQGHNRSDDLFMFLKRRIGAADRIVANQTYRIDYVVTLASNAASGCFGAGGAPGESVFLKVGASPFEPRAVLQSNGVLRMNVDIGNQSQSGAAASVAGNIANGVECDSAFPILPFVFIERSHRHPTNVTANANGELWLIVGTDSGFEGLTRLYYKSIKVQLIPV